MEYRTLRIKSVRPTTYLHGVMSKVKVKDLMVNLTHRKIYKSSVHLPIRENPTVNFMGVSIILQIDTDQSTKIPTL